MLTARSLTFNNIITLIIHAGLQAFRTGGSYALLGISIGVWGEKTLWMWRILTLATELDAELSAVAYRNRQGRHVEETKERGDLDLGFAFTIACGRKGCIRLFEYCKVSRLRRTDTVAQGETFAILPMCLLSSTKAHKAPCNQVVVEANK